MWFKNLHTNELEEFTSKIDRTTLSLWIQDRARRKLATPEKRIEELTASRASEACHRGDPNYCVIAFYTDTQSKGDALSLLTPLLAKYKDDPVTFWTIDARALKPGCPVTEVPKAGFSIFVVRSKRNKIESAGRDRAAVASKVDYALGGNMLSDSMNSPIADCFA